MTAAESKLERISAKNTAELRAWFEKHFEQKESVWVVIFKKETGKQTLTYNDIVEEALCFGWIDSVANKLNDESFLLRLSPRKPQSVWSKINKERVKKLIVEKRMTSAGLKVIEIAKKNGSWDKLNDIDNLIIPDDLKKLLDKNKTAKKYFEAFPPSSKKIILSWISSAKTGETRQKRIEKTVELAEQNMRANHYRQ